MVVVEMNFDESVDCCEEDEIVASSDVVDVEGVDDRGICEINLRRRSERLLCIGGSESDDESDDDES